MGSEVQALVGRAWDGIADLLAGCDEVDLVRPSRCAGWSVVDVLVHVLSDLERALTACATPTDAAPTVDAASYWRSWADVDPVALARGTRFLRVTASAYRGPEGLLARWRDVAPAAARAVAARDPAERVRTQGHVLTVDDLARTLVVEAAVHHLDCLLDLPGRPGPPAEALGVVRATAEALLGQPLPPGDDTGWALRSAGRLPLTPAERDAVGPAAEAFPLLG